MSLGNSPLLQLILYDEKYNEMNEVIHTLIVHRVEWWMCINVDPTRKTDLAPFLPFLASQFS
jgi:hypothetical protein